MVLGRQESCADNRIGLSQWTSWTEGNPPVTALKEYGYSAWGKTRGQNPISGARGKYFWSLQIAVAVLNGVAFAPGSSTPLNKTDKEPRDTAMAKNTKR